MVLHSTLNSKTNLAGDQFTRNQHDISFYVTVGFSLKIRRLLACGYLLADGFGVIRGNFLLVDNGLIYRPNFNIGLSVSDHRAHIICWWFGFHLIAKKPHHIIH